MLQLLSSKQVICFALVPKGKGTIWSGQLLENYVMDQADLLHENEDQNEETDSFFWLMVGNICSKRHLPEWIEY